MYGKNVTKEDIGELVASYLIRETLSLIVQGCVLTLLHLLMKIIYASNHKF